MFETVTVFHPETGEVRDVDGGNDSVAKRKRHYLYLQGWKRPDRMCKVMWDMYRCDHKRLHPERFHLLHLYDRHAEDRIEGKTLQALTLQVQVAYEKWHIDRAYCARGFLPDADCIHARDQRALHTDTKQYLRHLGYEEYYQQVGDVWIGLWEHRY